MKRNRSIAILFVLAAIAGLAGTAWWMTAPGRPGSASPPEKMRIALTDYIGGGLVHVAAAKGYFAQEGLEVTLQLHTSGRDALDAAIDGRTDLATVGDTPLMFAAMKGAPISIVATIFSAGQAHGIVARRDRGIASPGDLAGKTVGTPFRTDGHFVTGVMLSAYGKSLTSVRLENLRPEELTEALASGRVDAISAWEPWIDLARKAIGDNGVVFHTDRGFLFRFSLAGRKSWVDEHQEAVVSMLKALARAKDFATKEPDEFRALVIKSIGANPSIFEPGGPSYRYEVRLDQSLLIMLEDEARWAINSNLVEGKELPNLLQVIDSRAIQAAIPGSVSIVR